MDKKINYLLNFMSNINDYKPIIDNNNNRFYVDKKTYKSLEKSNEDVQLLI